MCKETDMCKTSTRAKQKPCVYNNNNKTKRRHTKRIKHKATLWDANNDTQLIYAWLGLQLFLPPPSWDSLSLCLKPCSEALPPGPLLPSQPLKSCSEALPPFPLLPLQPSAELQRSWVCELSWRGRARTSWARCRRSSQNRRQPIGYPPNGSGPSWPAGTDIRTAPKKHTASKQYAPKVNVKHKQMLRMYE